jgi:hypothetical protein
MQSLAVALALVLMGRPVFNDKTLAELAADSELVLEVEQATPFTATRTNAEGCPEDLWRVVVREVVAKKGAAAPAVGKTVEIINNPTALFDCMARKKNPSGVSFSAPRYAPSAATPGRRFLVFVNVAPRGYIVTVQNGWDVVEKKGELGGAKK